MTVDPSAVQPLEGHEFVDAGRDAGYFVWACTCGISETTPNGEEHARARHAWHVEQIRRELEADAPTPAP